MACIETETDYSRLAALSAKTSAPGHPSLTARLPFLAKH
jgi:hypothetical protein